MIPTPDIECSKSLNFHGDQIAVVKLCDWLDWVTQTSNDVAVALPMIQRGSVWKPKQIVDLWDSLLRGMPVGSLTVSRLEEERKITYRVVKEKLAREEVLQKGTLFLLDGQQRTLAMCLGWSACADRRVWIDFGRAGTEGHPFHLRVTTQNQPFGFNIQEPDKKLSRGDRDKAREAFDKQRDNEKVFLGKPSHSLPLDQTEPFGAKHPLPLHQLIDSWRIIGNDNGKWTQETMANLKLPSTADSAVVEQRVAAFSQALASLFEMQLALVRVRKELIEFDADAHTDNVPPLVVLFQRIANAGKPLSNADYIFSLIKHRFPEAHNLVNSLHEQDHVASLLSANEVVMTAVRIAAGANKQSGGKAFPDYVAPTPKEFDFILRASVDGGGSFLETALLPLITPDSSHSMHRAFEALQQLLEYRPSASATEDIGLPRLAFPLLKPSLVQVLLFWIHQTQRNISDTAVCAEVLEASRVEILRFALFWLLGIDDKDKASRHCIALLRTGDYPIFPGKALYQLLYDEDIAWGIQPLNQFEGIAISNDTNASPIRFWDGRVGWREADSPEVQEAKALYGRWFHKKSILLWLQRRMLAKCFPHSDPLAGRDDETPYDYDHICPHNDWGHDFRSRDLAFKKYCEDRRADIIGNCIGNYRVLDSSTNRKLQDMPADLKLDLSTLKSKEPQELLRDSAIDPSEAEDYRKVSDFKQQGAWTQERALAFQEVVERRAFRLFTEYYQTAGFYEWLDGQIDSVPLAL